MEGAEKSKRASAGRTCTATPPGSVGSGSAIEIGETIVEVDGSSSVASDDPQPLQPPPPVEDGRRVRPHMAKFIGSPAWALSRAHMPPGPSTLFELVDDRIYHT